MLAKPRADKIDQFIDAALTRSANAVAPDGFEERILERIARRKARQRRGLQAAGFVAAGALFLSGLFGPVNSGRVSPGNLDPYKHVAAGAGSGTLVPAGNEAPDEAAVALTVNPPDPSTSMSSQVHTGVERIELDPVDDEESLISGFEIESIGIAALHLPDLSSKP
jgi:hypothetical protein